MTDPIDASGPLAFPLHDVQLDALMDGTLPAAGMSPEQAELAQVLVALRAPGTAGELVGLPGALTAFTDLQAVSATPAALRTARKQLGRAATVAAVATVFALGCAGAAAAAYTGNLPTPVQHLAHVTIGAPDAGYPTDDPSGDTQTGDAKADGGSLVTASQQPVATLAPDSTVSSLPKPTSAHQSTPAAGSVGQSNLGLCRAWAHMGAHANPNSAVVRSLSRLAGGAAGNTAGITAYCANVVPTTEQPTTSPDHGKPTVKPKTPTSTVAAPRTHPQHPVHHPPGNSGQHTGPPAGAPGH